MASEVGRGIRRIGANYARLFTTLALGLIEVPLLMYWLGKEGFGLTGLLGPTIGLTSIIQDMVTRSMVREIGVAYHSGDPERFKRVSNSCWVISIAAAALSALLFLILVFFVIPVLEIPDHLKASAQVFAVGGGVASCAMILLTPTANMYTVSERFGLQNLWQILRRAASVASAGALLLIMGTADKAANVAAYGIAFNACSILILVVSVLLMWKWDPRTRPRPSLATRATLREIWGTFGWNSLVTFALNVADKVPQIIVNRYFGLDGNAVYALARRLGFYARMITVGATFGLEAVSTRVASRRDDPRKGVLNLLKHTTRLHTFVAMPAGIAIAIMAEPLLRLWLGRTVENPEVIIPPAAIVVQILTVASVARGISEGWMRLLYGAGLVRHYAMTVVWSSIATPLLSWAAVAFLSDPLRYYSPAWVYTALFVISYMVVLPWIGAKALQISMGAFLQPMARASVASAACAPVLVAGLLIEQRANLSAWFDFGIVGATCAAYGACFALVAWFFVLTDDERRRAGATLRRLTGRARPGDAPTPPPDPSQDLETDPEVLEGEVLPKSRVQRGRRGDAGDFSMPDGF